MARNSRPQLTRLEARDTPSAGAEDVLSLPHLPGMSAEYPIDDIQTASVEGRAGDPLRVQPRPRYVVATSAGKPATVQVYDGPTNALLGIVTPFDDGFTGGVNVAVGDMTGDGVDDLVVASGGDHAPEVRVFDGATLRLVRSFLAFEADFTGGVYVAAGDVTGDGRADLVAGAGLRGGPRVTVFDGATGAAGKTFFAYEPEFRGGVTVAVGDADGDGVRDIITGAGPGGGPRVRVISGRDGSTLEDYFAFDPATRTGVSVAAADFGRGHAEVVAVPLSGGPSVRLYDRGNLEREFTPFGERGRPGSVVARDLDGDGVAELIAASAPGSEPRVVVFDASSGEARRDLPAQVPDYTLGLRVG